MNLFGFEISRRIKKSSEKQSGEQQEAITLPSFSNPPEPDTAYIDGGYASGYFGQVLDIEGVNFTSEADLIQKYRTAASQPECDTAINDIVNASIVSDSDDAPVNIILDKSDLPDNIKDLIREEFKTVLRLLSFNFEGHDIFRRWYIDGKIYYHLMVDPKNTRKGIQEVRMIDPIRIKKIKEYTAHTDKASGEKVRKITSEYYLYTEDSSGGAAGSGLKIDPNSVVYVPSGILDNTGKISISHLHKCVKLVNQLRMMEDALVIYRISRAPERRVFYIDVGNLQKGKAEEYVQGIMSRYRNKLIYDASSGEIQEDRKSMSILEDFWLPRREGGRGTEITTLPGGENLGQIDDVVFFQKKLYRALNIPVSRLDPEGGAFNIGRVSEISREEVKFQKFINRLRRRFSTLFIDMLRVQCLLKNICTEEDWEEIKESIAVDYIEDNFFSELKDFEILKERISMLDAIQTHIGKYYSEKWVKSNILNLSDEEIERMDLENVVEPPEEEEPESEVDDMGMGFDSGSEEPFESPPVETEPEEIPAEEPEAAPPEV